MTTKDILQIILIPILTLILTKSWDFISKQRARNLEKDKEIYQSIKKGFEGERDLVYFFREHTVSNLTPREDIWAIDKLKILLEGPGFVFTIRKLEKLRKELLERINKYQELTSRNFFVHDTVRDHFELKYSRRAESLDDPGASEKFKQLYEEIDSVGTEIYEIYIALAEKAQKKL